jgi:hypothetical protein
MTSGGGRSAGSTWARFSDDSGELMLIREMVSIDKRSSALVGLSSWPDCEVERELLVWKGAFSSMRGPPEVKGRRLCDPPMRESRTISQLYYLDKRWNDEGREVRRRRVSRNE